MRKTFAQLMLMLSMLTYSYAQYTTVTTTGITDSDGILWTNGTVSVAFQPNPAQSNLSNYKLCSSGANLSTTVLNQGPVSLGAGGSFSFTVYDNSLVCPQGSTYQFTICPNATSKCGTINLPITGASIVITAQLDAAIPAPRFPATVGNYGYADVETVLSTPIGGTYWNVVSSCQKYYNGSSWSCGNGNGSLTAPVLITQGGTGATAAAGAMGNLLPGIGIIDAAQHQSPTGTGNNGIANSLTSCASLAYPCSIIAPALYAQVEAQPFGGSPTDYYPPITLGPSSSQPTASFLDERYGVPQWIFNQSQPVSNRFPAQPTFAMNNISGPGQGLFLHYATALTLQSMAFANGRNSYADKTNFNTMNMQSYRYTQAQGGGDLAQSVNCMGNGDCVGHTIDTITYGGPNTQSDEGNESMRYEAIEGGQVFGATVATVAIGSDGSGTITTSAQTNNGFQGEGRLLIDLTKGYNGVANSNYLASIAASGGNEIWTCGGTCNWDSTFGDSTQTTLSTDINNGLSSNNTFPQSNVTLQVTSSMGFTVGNLACIFDYDYECEKITAVGIGTVTIATDRLPHVAGAYVTTGGLAGYSIEAEADRVAPGALNGIAPNPDSGLVSTIRNVIPIMFNSHGNTLTTFQGGNTIPGASGGYTGRAYASMGSGGSATVTIAGGNVTSCTATGGSGYSSVNNPPQLVISGITYLTAPVIAVTGISGGSLTGCTVENFGVAIAGTPVVTVTPYNPYDIYPTTKVTGVYNAASGSVDGTLYTEPLSGAFSTADLIENPHYFWQHMRGSNNAVGSYIPSLTNAAGGGLLYAMSGLPQGGDTGIAISNNTASTVYSGYPLGTPWVAGLGQAATPYGIKLNGPFNVDFEAAQPPFGSIAAAMWVRNNTPQTWTSPFYMFLTSGWNGSAAVNDGLSYNPSTRAWTLTGSAFTYPTTASVTVSSSGPSYFGTGTTGTNYGFRLNGGASVTPTLSMCAFSNGVVTGCGTGYGPTFTLSATGFQISSSTGAFQTPIFSDYDGIGAMWGNTGAVGVAISSSSKLPQIGAINPGINVGVVNAPTPTLSTSVAVGTLTPSTTYYYKLIGVIYGSTNTPLSAEASFAASASGSIAVGMTGTVGIQTFSVCRGTSSGAETTLVASGLGLSPTGNSYTYQDIGTSIGTCPTSGSGTVGNTPVFTGTMTPGHMLAVGTATGSLLNIVDGGGAGGTVTSVALKSATPNLFSGTTGMAVSVSGTLDPDAQLATQAANCVVAGPTTGSAAVPTCRALVSADVAGLTATTYKLASTPLVNTGSTSSTFVGSILIPAGAMGTSSILNLTLRTSACNASNSPHASCTTVNTGTCSPIVYFSSASNAQTGPSMFAFAATAAKGGYGTATISNANSLSLQSVNSWYTFNTSTGVQVFADGAIPTANNSYLNVWMGNSVSADKCFVDAAFVQLIP